MTTHTRCEATRPFWLPALGTLVFAPLFVGAVIGLGPFLLSGWRVQAPFFGAGFTRWIGAALIGLPVPTMLDFLWRFVRDGRGTPAPFAPPQRLVVTGPLRHVRNPAYLCADAMLVGQGLLLGSTAVLAYAAVTALAFHLLVVLYEEPALHATFGADYDAYCAAVPRWIPRLTPPRS
jgi:protein-S-isoprenylcysteine O-methyltransferase Ste14